MKSINSLSTIPKLNRTLSLQLEADDEGSSTPCSLLKCTYVCVQVA